MTENGSKSTITTSDIVRVLGVSAFTISQWVDALEIPFEYGKSNNKKSIIRVYDAKYAELFAQLAMYNRLRRIDLIIAILGDQSGGQHSGSIRGYPNLAYDL